MWTLPVEQPYKSNESSLDSEVREDLVRDHEGCACVGLESHESVRVVHAHWDAVGMRALMVAFVIALKMGPT